jgi:hypothetical protein
MAPVAAADVPMARGDARTATVDPITTAAEVHRFSARWAPDVLLI